MWNTLAMLSSSKRRAKAKAKVAAANPQESWLLVARVQECGAPDPGRRRRTTLYVDLLHINSTISLNLVSHIGDSVSNCKLVSFSAPEFAGDPRTSKATRGRFYTAQYIRPDCRDITRTDGSESQLHRSGGGCHRV